MKKILTIMLALLMVLCLAGCKQEEEKKPAEKLKIAYCINGSKGDKSFFDSGSAGMDKVNAELGDKAEAVCLEFTYDDSTWKSQLSDVFASEKYDIIIVGTYDMLEMTVELTKEYPDQKVWFYDEQWDFDTNPRENVISLLFKQNEGSYVVGYMAAMVTKTDHISFCGGMSNTVLLDFYAGYKQGAEAYAAKAGKSIIVEETWMNSFSEAAKGKDVANASYNQGVDIVFACGGGAGLGVFEAALEHENVYVIGVDGNQGAYFASQETAEGTAKAAKTLTSMTKNVDNGFYDTVVKAINGELEYGKNYRLGLDGNYVGAAITDATKAALTDAQLAEVEAVKADIVSGKIKVDTAF